MRCRLAIAVLCVCAAAPATFAGGFYAGASYGNTTLQVDEPGFSFDADDPSWKVFVGFRFLKLFGVEGSYLDLGSPTDGSVTIETKAWTGFAVGVLPLGPFGLFAKVGAIASDAEVLGASSESSTDPAYGVGAEFGISKIAIRAEYELFDVQDTDTMYMISVGAAWRF